MTIFVGIVTMWLLPDWPHNCRWLSEEEKLLAQQRMAEDASAADEDLSGARFLREL